MRSLHTISLVAAIIGGLNFGLIGIFNFDLIAALFGEMTLITRSLYVLIGIGAFALLFFSLPSEGHTSDMHSNSGKTAR